MKKLKRVIKGVIKKILVFFYSIPFKIIRTYPNRYVLLNSFCCAANKNSDFYFQYSMKPKYIKGYTLLPQQGHNDTAIILQGPVNDADFLIETVKFYKKMYPDTYIIVSTWNGTEKSLIEKIKKLGVIIVCSELPEYSGIANINYQMKSTRAGVNKARELNVKYVLKTRTDQRLYRRGVITYFKELLKTFPVQTVNNNQKERIIILQGGYGNLFLPFYHSDFLYFGTINDIESLFGDDNFFRKSTQAEVNYNLNKFDLTRDEFLNYASSQSWFLEAYAKKMMNCDNIHNVKSCWQFMKDYMIGISGDDVQLFWPKYEQSCYQIEAITGNYNILDNEKKQWSYNWNMFNWVAIYYDDLTYNKCYEQYRKRLNVEEFL